MTDRQEIRAKSLELAINLIGFIGPFDIKKVRELFPKEDGKNEPDEVIKVLKGLNTTTDIFEKIISDTLVQHNE